MLIRYFEQILNRHSPKNTAYQVGVSEDKGIRRTMEDAHSFVVDFAGVRGQGFFAVFDGHAGKHAAEWCGNHFHTVRQGFFPHRFLERHRAMISTKEASFCVDYLASSFF
jgi:serine/threonine protein phosphatase PrpC